MSSTHLAVVPCVLCGHPVAHYDPAASIGARVGGLCMRDSCRTDPKTRQRRFVYTFERLLLRGHEAARSLQPYREADNGVSAL